MIQILSDKKYKKKVKKLGASAQFCQVDLAAGLFIEGLRVYPAEHKKMVIIPASSASRTIVMLSETLESIEKTLRIKK